MKKTFDKFTKAYRSILSEAIQEAPEAGGKVFFLTVEENAELTCKAFRTFDELKNALASLVEAYGLVTDWLEEEEIMDNFQSEEDAVYGDFNCDVTDPKKKEELGDYGDIWVNVCCKNVAWKPEYALYLIDEEHGDHIGAGHEDVLEPVALGTREECQAAADKAADHSDEDELGYIGRQMAGDYEPFIVKVD